MFSPISPAVVYFRKIYMIDIENEINSPSFLVLTKIILYDALLPLSVLFEYCTRL